MSVFKHITNKFGSLRWKVKNRLHRAILNRLDLQQELPPGIIIKIGSLADWMLYNEIFVLREYDQAIAAALALPDLGTQVNILDLGANVGFFALRAGYLSTGTLAAGTTLQITCVEGSPSIHAELIRRISACPGLREKIRVVHGLVGKRHGFGHIVESPFHAMNSIDSTNRMGASVAYVDFATLFGDQNRIHLLKCDIEGSEWDFIKDHGFLLERTSVAVFEFHRSKCDEERCEQQLAAYGLVNPKILNETKFTSVRMYVNSAG